jgi:hypothetical protein
MRDTTQGFILRRVDLDEDLDEDLDFRSPRVNEPGQVLFAFNQHRTGSSLGVVS